MHATHTYTRRDQLAVIAQANAFVHNLAGLKGAAYGPRERSQYWCRLQTIAGNYQRVFRIPFLVLPSSKRRDMIDWLQCLIATELDAPEEQS